MKIGDELLCKCKFNYKITSAGVFKKNKKYRIKDIIYRTNYDYDGSHDLLTKLKYFMINDNYYSEYFVNTHFYSEQEIRKLKLEKIEINENRNRKNNRRNIRVK